MLLSIYIIMIKILYIIIAILLMCILYKYIKGYFKQHLENYSNSEWYYYQSPYNFNCMSSANEVCKNAENSAKCSQREYNNCIRSDILYSNNNNPQIENFAINGSVAYDDNTNIERPANIKIDNSCFTTDQYKNKKCDDQWHVPTTNNSSWRPHFWKNYPDNPIWFPARTFSGDSEKLPQTGDIRDCVLDTGVYNNNITTNNICWPIVNKYNKYCSDIAKKNTNNLYDYKMMNTKCNIDR